MGLGVGAGERVFRALLMVIWMNAESLTVIAMTDGAVVLAHFGLKLRSMGIVMARLALMRCGDELPHRFLSLCDVALDAGDGLVPTI